MSQDKLRNKTLKKKRKFFAIILALSLYFLMSFMSTIFGIGHKTILPETGILYDKTVGEAFVIKDESLYTAEGKGMLNLLVKEGDRVGVGVEIASISIVKDDSKLQEDLIEVEQQIAMLSKKNTNPNSDTIDGMTNNLIDRIQQDVSSEEFTDIHGAKEELSALDNYSNKESLLSKSIDSLNAQKESILNQINNGSLKYYSKSSGIVSYEIDGYENLLLPKDFETYTYDNIQLKDIKKSEIKDNIDIGEPIFKIIDNFEWYMAIKIEDKKDIQRYHIGQAMKIKLEDEHELIGKIKMINYSGPNAVVILKFNTYLHSNYNLRHAQVELIHSKKEGFKIPKRVIIEVDGNKGVYIKEINGIVKFRPIKVFGEEGDFSFIDKGDSNGFIELVKDEKIKTVTLFDEIFTDPSNVVEGEILK